MENNTRKIIAFDLDETMMTPSIDARGEITGANVRASLEQLLTTLSASYTLHVWSSGDRRYVEKMLRLARLTSYFERVIAWEDYNAEFKDVRRFHIDYLIDDNEALIDTATQLGIADRYIIVPQLWADDDQGDRWIELIMSRLS